MQICLTSEIFVHKARHWALYYVWFQRHISCINMDLIDVCSVHYHILQEMKQSTKCFVTFGLLQTETDNKDNTIIWIYCIQWQKLVYL